MGRSDALLLITSIALAGVIFIELGSSNRDNPASESQPARVETEPARVRPPEPIVQDLVATTLARPLFDRTRRPLNTSSSENVAERDLPAVRLTGIVLEPGLRFAIFAIPDAKPVALSEGEALKGWRLDSILPHAVSLSGPGGTKTLEPKGDSSLVRQAPIPALPGTPRVGVPPGSAQTSTLGQPVSVKPSLLPAPPPPKAPKPLPRRGAHDG